jgi:DNA-binding XRE family transcriptional regulator
MLRLWISVTSKPPNVALTYQGKRLQGHRDRCSRERIVLPVLNDDRHRQMRRVAAAQIGESLHQARVARGLSQEAVAHRAGISVFTYCHLERGYSSDGGPTNPRLDTLLKVLDVLELDARDLVAADRPSGDPTQAAIT